MKLVVANTKYLAAVAGLALAITVALGLWQSQPTEAGGQQTISLPTNAVEVEPDVFYIGSAVYNGRVVDGYAYVHRANVPTDHRRDAAKPPWAGGGGGGDDSLAEADCYSFTKSRRWLTTEPWVLNASGSPFSYDQLEPLLTGAQGDWELHANAFDIFGTGSASVASGYALDGVNLVYFGNFAEDGVIAVTITWAYRGGPNGKEIVEWDMLFDTDFTWSLAGASGSMDFRNIAEHEIGHAAGMGHSPTDPVCVGQTMYPTASFGETDKRSLELGDTTGIGLLY